MHLVLYVNAYRPTLCEAQNAVALYWLGPGATVTNGGSFAQSGFAEQGMLAVKLSQKLLAAHFPYVLKSNAPLESHLKYWLSLKIYFLFSCNSRKNLNIYVKHTNFVFLLQTRHWPAIRSISKAIANKVKILKKTYWIIFLIFRSTKKLTITFILNEFSSSLRVIASKRKT